MTLVHPGRATRASGACPSAACSVHAPRIEEELFDAVDGHGRRERCEHSERALRVHAVDTCFVGLTPRPESKGDGAGRNEKHSTAGSACSSVSASVSTPSRNQATRSSSSGHTPRACSLSIGVDACFADDGRSPPMDLTLVSDEIAACTIPGTSVWPHRRPPRTRPARRDHPPAGSIRSARRSPSSDDDRMSDVVEMVDRVVDEVAGERFDVEPGAVAALSATSPLITGHALNRTEIASAAAISSTATPPATAARTGRRSPRRPGPSSGTADRPA